MIIILLLRNNIERSILFNFYLALKMHFPTKKRSLPWVRDMFQLMENQHHLQLMVNDGKSRRRDFLSCTNIRRIARDTPRKKEEFVLHSYTSGFISGAKIRSLRAHLNAYTMTLYVTYDIFIIIMSKNNVYFALIVFRCEHKIGNCVFLILLFSE